MVYWSDMPDKRWKRAEREYARMLGGTRTGPTGKDSPDIKFEDKAPNSHLAVEVKSRESLPAWLLAAMEQAETNAPAGKLPLCILHRARDPFDEALVVVRMKDWKEWYGCVSST